nr:HNH endonuclease signature motif containing protein [Rhodococcus sp. MEB064]
MRHSEEKLRNAVSQSVSIAGVLRYLGVAPTGDSHAHISRRITRLRFDTSHFTGQAHRKGVPAGNRQTALDILVVRPPGSARAKPHHLRRALTESGVPERCRGCGLGTTWNGSRLRLHVDHVDGNYFDCRLANLRYLCPNCHSQTATWARRRDSGTTATTLPDDTGVD